MTGERTGGAIQSVAELEVMREVGSTFAVAQPGGAQAAGVLKQQRGMACRRGAVAAVTLGPLLQLAALSRRPVAVGERSRVIGILAAIVAGGQEQRMPPGRWVGRTGSR